MAWNNTREVLVVLVILLSMTAGVYAVVQPEGPTATYVRSENYTAGGAYSRGSAEERGSITWINFDGRTQTNTWKGYVGNVTGKLNLEDADGDVLYDWSIASTTGEVYALRKSTAPTWANVECANAATIANEESALDITGSADDALDQTFSNSTTHAAFGVGSKSIPAGRCNATHLYVNNASSDDFSEVLLRDTADSNYVIYASLINNSATGFDGAQYDFQMIVAENASSGTPTPITYYFYLELV
jgi:hypothetical protein